MAATEPETRRIVLLGKTGSGKSSLANTLFGEKNVFTVNHSVNSGTKFCESQIKNINGRNIQLIDTPGLFDTNPRNTDLSPALLKCITECAPGPHAFLLVLKMEKYTEQEQAVVEIILKYFSVEALKYTTLVFTRGDDLEEGSKIKDWVNGNEALKNLVQKCGDRCHVFDNKYWNNSEDEYRNNQYQVQELLKTIDQTEKENRGGCYTNTMLQMVQEEIEKEMVVIRPTTPRNMPQEEIRKRAKQNILSRFYTILAGISTGALLGATLGLKYMCMYVYFVIKNLNEPWSIVLTGAAAANVVSTFVGGAVTGYKAAENVETPEEAVQATMEAMSEVKKLLYK